MLRYETAMITLDRENLSNKLAQVFFVKLKETVCRHFHSCVFERHETFSEKRQFVVDDERLGRLVGMKTGEDMESICNNT